MKIPYEIYVQAKTLPRYFFQCWYSRVVHKAKTKKAKAVAFDEAGKIWDDKNEPKKEIEGLILKTQLL